MQVSGFRIYFLEPGYFFSIILSEFLKNRVALHLARRDLSVFGGHLRPGCLVNTTAEIVLAELPDTVFTRERDEATGYEELAIRKIDRQF